MPTERADDVTEQMVIIARQGCITSVGADGRHLRFDQRFSTSQRAVIGSSFDSAPGRGGHGGG